jgi:hypothetical protein
MTSIHLESVGPMRVLWAALLAPELVKLGGRPWGGPRFGARLLFNEKSPTLCEAIDTVVLAQWSDGPPQQLRHPIRDGAEIGYPGRYWCHAGCPETEPPTLFIRAADGAVTDFDHREDRARIYPGAEVLVALDVTAYSPAPWAGGVDLTLRACCFTGNGERIGGGAADAFARALSAA